MSKAVELFNEIKDGMHAFAEHIRLHNMNKIGYRQSLYNEWVKKSDQLNQLCKELDEVIKEDQRRLKEEQKAKKAAEKAQEEPKKPGRPKKTSQTDV